jgi:hypothetical protein
MEDGARMERNYHPVIRFAVDAMAPLDRNHENPAAIKARSASEAVHLGNLGIHFEGGCQNLAAQR